MNQLLKEFNQRQSDQIVAFLFCDLDCCKEINASLGHSVGDAVLEITAQPMLSILREQDKAARIAGDEIVVILNGGPEITAVLTAVTKIQHTLARPGEDAEPLINRADQGKHRAKRSGRGRTMASD